MFDFDRVRSSWQREGAAIDALVVTVNARTAAEPVRNDGRTTQNVVGHIANSARGFLAFIRGEVRGFFDVHADNAQHRERGQRRSWEGVQRNWQRARDDVFEFLAAADTLIGEQAVELSHLPPVRNAGDALRALIVHTRAHRTELEQGFPDVQAIDKL